MGGARQGKEYFLLYFPFIGIIISMIFPIISIVISINLNTRTEQNSSRKRNYKHVLFSEIFVALNHTENNIQTFTLVPHRKVIKYVYNNRQYESVKETESYFV